MSKTMEAIKMIADAFESHDGRAVEQAIFTISDARLLMDALSEGPRFKGQASLRPEAAQQSGVAMMMALSPTRAEAMLERLKADAVVSKFATARECQAYRAAVDDMLTMIRLGPQSEPKEKKNVD